MSVHVLREATKTLFCEDGICSSFISVAMINRQLRGRKFKFSAQYWGKEGETLELELEAETMEGAAF